MTMNASEARASKLEARRLEKMAESAHAFVRGNTREHYAWLSELAPLPEGPPVWICGDCHVGNLGPIADKRGNVDVQIRDLDQTTIGNPAHDIVRLALSLASAARSSDLPGVTTAKIVENMIAGYEAGLDALDGEQITKEPATVTTVRRQALGREWRHLATERLGDIKPAIPLGKKFWELNDEEKWSLGVLLDTPAVKRLILTLSKRTDRARVELLDAAYWMKGCSSLGKLRFAALVHLSGERKDKLSLIDIKEAVASAAPSVARAELPTDNAERVVAGARALSPNLGDRMAAAVLNEKPVVIRELMPEDLKLEMEQFTRREAAVAARYLAGVVGRSHGRQMDPTDRRSWSRELRSRHPENLAAPSWLWSTVVALLTRHEGAYLEHCRLYGQVAAK